MSKTNINISVVLKSLVGFALGLLAMALVAEGYFRATRVVTPAFNRVDDEVGRARRPGLFWVVFNEGFSMGRFNEFGYNGPGYPPEKDKGVIRIALLGDSFVEGYQVFDRHHFRSRLEELLNLSMSDSVEVLNFGRNGFNLQYNYIYFSHFVQQFNPDHTVLFLSSIDFGPGQADQLMPSVEVTDAALKIVPPDEALLQRYRKAERFTHQAYMLSMLNAVRRQAISVSVAEILLDKFYIPRPKDSQKDVAERSGLSRTERLMLRDMATSTNLLVADTDASLPEEFKTACRDLGVPVIPLGEMLEVKVPDALYWPVTGQTGHWNHEAHRAVAELLHGFFVSGGR